MSSSLRSLIHLPDEPAGVCSLRVKFVTLVLSGGLTFAVAAGADEPPGPSESPLTASDRDHWAFQPIRLPVLPLVKDGGWCRTPMDRFILAKLESARLSPSPEADCPTLLRRLTFDLTGLPPTPEELDAFVADQSPDACERVVDRLLQSPAYAERAAQHWLDLARFAETDGFEHDLERPNAWRYRDWVIDALGRDLPFDEFLRLQLAGDEIHPNDMASSVATGFLLCGPDMPDINLQEERRSNFLNDLTGTVGSALLGLQIGCAQCHDHKYDPISQFDFYRLRAFFDPVEIFKDHPLPGHVPPPPSPEMRERLEKLKGLEEQVRLLEEGARQKLRAENPDLQPSHDDLVKALPDEDRARHKDLSKDIAQLKKSVRLPEVPHGRVVRESAASVKASRLLIRGDFRREGPELPPDFPRVANLDRSNIEAPEPMAPTTGRRSQFANWLFRPANPLTARVIVNRIWQQHFGRGLVDTPSDFGRMGAEPTHPELLDWLASELPRQGWSLKGLHRSIVLSAVYRQASHSRVDGAAAAEPSSDDSWERARATDPDNRLFWHFPRHRLEGEAIRDALLAASGKLSARRGGPGIRPPLPAELVSTLLKNQWNVTPDVADHDRRSIYLFVRRNLRFPLFEAFDRPDTNASCPRRNRSTIAPQALVLLNSELSLAAARDLAGLVLAQGDQQAAGWIRSAVRATLGREPDEAELRTAESFLTLQAERLRNVRRPVEELALPRPMPAGADPYVAAALTDYCLALFNLNEFVYVD